MNPDRMKERKVNFSSRQHAILKSHSLQFNKIASSNPREGKGNIIKAADLVEGTLYEIDSSDRGRLDSFEGYPKEYDSMAVLVQLDNGTEVEAFTYIAKPNRIGIGLKPTKEYLSHYLTAKDVLSPKYYQKLASWPTLD